MIDSYSLIANYNLAYNFKDNLLHSLVLQGSNRDCQFPTSTIKRVNGMQSGSGGGGGWSPFQILWTRFPDISVIDVEGHLHINVMKFGWELYCALKTRYKCKGENLENDKTCNIASQQLSTQQEFLRTSKIEYTTWVPLKHQLGSSFGTGFSQNKQPGLNCWDQSWNHVRWLSYLRS